MVGLLPLLAVEILDGDALEVECPTGSEERMDLSAAACELSRRLASVFPPDASGRRWSRAAASRASSSGGATQRRWPMAPRPARMRRHGP